MVRKNFRFVAFSRCSFSNIRKDEVARRRSGRPNVPNRPRTLQGRGSTPRCYVTVSICREVSTCRQSARALLEMTSPDAARARARDSRLARRPDDEYLRFRSRKCRGRDSISKNVREKKITLTHDSRYRFFPAYSRRPKDMLIIRHQSRFCITSQSLPPYTRAIRYLGKRRETEIYCILLGHALFACRAVRSL